MIFHFNIDRIIRKFFLLIICLTCFQQFAHAQFLGGLSSTWDDSFREWEIIYFEPNPEAESEDDAYNRLQGSLQLRWVLKEDWRVWEFEIGEILGEIRQKWENNPELWEVTAFNEIITMRTVWPGDLTQWKVTNGSQTIFIQSRFRNIVDEWNIRDTSHGTFDIYTDVDGDARDWIIEDGLDENVSYGFKMALAFIAVYHSMPKI